MPRTVICNMCTFVGRKFASYLLVIVLLATLLIAESEKVDASNPLTISVEHAISRCGEEIEVDVSVINNPGILGITLDLEYDEKLLELSSIEKGEEINYMKFTEPKDLRSGCQLSWNVLDVNPKEVVKDGVIASLKFKIKNSASVNSITCIKLSYKEGTIIDNNDNSIQPVIENSYVKVVDYILGDSNYDGSIDAKDALTVLKHAAKIEKLDETESSDVDCNDNVDASDALSILKYAAKLIYKFDVKIKPEEISAGISTATPISTPTVLPTETINSDPTIIISDKNTNAGEKVEVTVSLKNNPGILGMTLELNYDETVMELVNIEKGEALSELTFTKPRNLSSGCRLPWDAEFVATEDISNGKILILTFEIKENISQGSYEVSLSYDDGAIIDNDINSIKVAIKNGHIIVDGSSEVVIPTVTPMSPLETAPVNTPIVTEMPSRDPIININSVSASSGEEVKVVVSLKNNPGILGMTLSLNYDESAMKLSKVEKGEALSELTFTTPKNLNSGCRFPWDAELVSPNDITNGNILILTFDIFESASGVYEISLSYDDGAIIDNEIEPIDVVIRKGYLAVR